MGKEKRKLCNGTGPYSGMRQHRRRVEDICPFDKDNKEDIKNMDIELNVKRDIKVVSDEIGKRSRLKPSTFQNERRFIK